MALASNGWVEWKFLVFLFDSWGTHFSSVQIPYSRYIGVVSGTLSFLVLAISVWMFLVGLVQEIYHCLGFFIVCWCVVFLVEEVIGGEWMIV